MMFIRTALKESLRTDESQGKRELGMKLFPYLGPCAVTMQRWSSVIINCCCLHRWHWVEDNNSPNSTVPFIIIFILMTLSIM